MYFVAEQSSSELIKPGRQLLDKEVRTYVMAEGVNGLLRMRRESFVVWALRILEASEISARGLGGS